MTDSQDDLQTTRDQVQQEMFANVRAHFDAPTLTTERLVIEPVTMDHAPLWFPMYADAEAMRFWITRPHETLADSQMTIYSYLRATLPTWTIFTRDDHAAIGCLWLIPAAITGMGYLIRREEWRKGYGTEAGRAVVRYAFETLKLDRLELWMHEENTASWRLALALGFTGRGSLPRRENHQKTVYEMRVYGLRADEWQRQTGAQVEPPPRVMASYGVSPILPVRDVKAALAYYETMFGFGEVWSDRWDAPTFAIVARGEWTSNQAALHLIRAEEGAESPPGSGAVYLLMGSSIDAYHEGLAARGVTISEAPHRTFYGVRRFTARDPDGNRITFAALV